MKSTKKEIIEKYKKQLKEVITDLKTKGRRHRQIPNILTSLRLFSPFIIIPAAITGNIPLTIGSAIAFSLTDMADGFIARNWNLTSDFGKDLDAVTDKIFAATLLTAGAINNPILLCNLGLEAYIANINVKEKLKGNKPESTPAGKAKTVSLFGLICSSLAPISFGISKAVLPLSILSGAWQIATIKSYKNKYNNQDEKIIRQKNFDNEEIYSYQENKNQKDYENAKTYEDKTSETIVIEQEASSTLEQLKMMSDFFHQEQENKYNNAEKGIQKSKASDISRNKRY